MFVTDYHPHARQLEFHTQAKRFAALAAGARGGKTMAAAQEAFKRIMLDRRRKKGKLHYWFVAPTLQIGKVQIDEFLRLLGGANGPLVKQYLSSERELRLHDDILIEFKTAERPDNLVAVGLDGLWLDEAARIKADAWLGNLRMRLADKQGWAIFSTTPLGRNWFYKHIVEPARAGRPDFSLHTWPTIDNTAVPGLRAEVERARRELPEAYFRREFEASFDAFIGQIYPEFSHEKHVVDQLPPHVVETRYGIDWGFRHPCAVLVLQRDGNGVWWVVDERVREGVLVQGDGPDWIGQARDLERLYGRGNWFCDPSAPAYIQSFRRAGLLARPAVNDVAAGIQTVARALHVLDGGPGLLIHRRCVQTIAALINYRWDPQGDGEEPLKEDDHAVDALRYALHTPRHRPAAW